ncbi:hypothetical protein [Azospirillum palustre]
MLTYPSVQSPSALRTIEPQCGCRSWPCTASDGKKSRPIRDVVMGLGQEILPRIVEWNHGSARETIGAGKTWCCAPGGMHRPA